MESPCEDPRDAASAKVLLLCETYLALNERRLELDEQLMMSSLGEQERELLWYELDAVLTELSSLVTQLAATSPTQPPAVRSKAAILALLLRSPNADDLLPLAPDATALALSVADEVAHLT